MSAASGLLTLVVSLLVAGQIEKDAVVYQSAPEAMRAVLDAPATPFVSLSPTREHLLLVQGRRYPSLAELAEPMLRLAGYRINPETSGPHHPARYHQLTLQTLADGTQRTIPLPENPAISFPRWSPDGLRFAFLHTRPDGIELWIADVQAATARRVPGLTINAAFGESFQWMPDSRTLLCQAIPADRGAPPQPPRVPAGPNIQETAGTAGPVRTYQDLLQTPYDADLFDHFATSQLVLVDAVKDGITAVGPPAVVSAVDPSPNGELLLVTTVQRPYSLLHPAELFPRRAEVWNLAGEVVQTIADLPLADNVPIEGVPTGPRNWQWRPSAPATVVWLEALDNGDPRQAAEHRDRFMLSAAPFEAEPHERLRLEQRYAGMVWGADDGLLLISDYDRERRWIRTFRLQADESNAAPHLIWERSIRDRYGDPGTPALRALPNGVRVLWQQASSLFLMGDGATPAGERPFLDLFDLATGSSERLFQCADGVYESVVALLSDDGRRFITRHESPTSPPNYRIRTAGTDDVQPLTDFPDPAPQLRGIRKELVTYTRPDGVPLSFTLYLPADYQPGQRLPALLWAYPREYNDPATAGQVSGSPYRFTMLGGASHLFLVLQGYAVLDNATIPIVGPPETANDTYIEQLVAGAKAAINKAAEMGVIDPQRVAAAGHSYGGFMTANLLTHSDLFRAGIARSGAYNRTLTPFGFQAERRTYWEAPAAYLRMSPFMSAHLLRHPLLLIHGEVDNNSGTFPIQSERLYQAIRGNGGQARLVTLPCESHGYAARESIEHVLFEMTTWLDRFVKLSE